MRRAEKERIKAGEAADEDMKKAKKETKKKVHESVTKTSKKKGSSDEDHSPGSHDEEDNGDDDVQWQTDPSLEAAQQRIKEQLTSATSEMVILENNDPENSKTTKKSNGKNGEVEVDNVSLKHPEQDNGEIDSNLNELSALSIHDELVLAFKNKMKKKNANMPSQLACLMQSSKGSPQEVMNAYFEALFDGAGKGFSKEVSKNKQFLAEVVQDEKSQKLLLGAIEAFCNHARVEAVKEVPLVLKFLYDEEILEEEIIYDWFDKSTTETEKKALPIWKYVKPFVEWLKNAEAESEEE